MARSSVTVKLNSRTARAILRSLDVQADLRERTDRIALAAGDGMTAEVSVGANRARGVVFTETADAMLSEAQDRRLTSALDAGR